MVKGDRGKVVRVDLSTQAITYDYVDEVTARKYVGGSGLAAKILWDETTPNTHPLSPENLLMFMTGPLTGTIVPSSSRYVVAGISPLTGIWGKATVGGKLAYELRHGGFDSQNGVAPAARDCHRSPIPAFRGPAIPPETP